MKPDLRIVVSNPPPAPELQAAPEQAEMPFAVVNGEPMTQLPRDLYIPPQALEIFLEAFEGPLDPALCRTAQRIVDTAARTGGTRSSTLTWRFGIPK